MFYNKILKDCFKFMVENGYAPTKLLIDNNLYYELVKEVYGNCEYVLVVHRKFLGMNVIIDETIKQFILK